MLNADFRYFVNDYFINVERDIYKNNRTSLVISNY